MIADKSALLIVVPRREGHNLARQAQQVFRLAGKQNGPLAVISVVQGPDADGVPGGDKLPRLPVIEDAGKLRVQHGKHTHPILPVEGEEDLAVGAAVKGVPLSLQPLFQLFKAVYLAVADGPTALQFEGLHPLGGQVHDSQAVEAQQTLPRRDHPAVVGPPASGAAKAPLKRLKIGHRAAISNNRAHNVSSMFCRGGLWSPAFYARLRPRRRDGATGAVGPIFTSPQTANRRRWGRASISSG